jgi:hypothetical protein
MSCATKCTFLTNPAALHPAIFTLLPNTQGGAVDTVSKGETVVAVPGMLGNKHLTGEGGCGAAPHLMMRGGGALQVS